jgi:hypothetical protein
MVHLPAGAAPKVTAVAKQFTRLGPERCPPMACPCLCEFPVNCSDLRLESSLGYCEGMKVAAYQAPLLATGSMYALGLIQKQVHKREAEGITVLCCPEAILGGLADDSENPNRFALRSDDGQLASALTPLASDTVTSIIGFSELTSDGTLYNAAVTDPRRLSEYECVK